MNVLAWFHYIVAIVYPAALPDTTTPSQAQPVKKVIQIERVVTSSSTDTIVAASPNDLEERHIEVVTHNAGGDGIADAIFPIAFLMAGTLMLWMATNANKQVKLAMIEKGMDPSTLNAKDTTRKFGALRFGMLLVGISTGLLAGFLINSLLSVAADSHEIVVATTTIFFAGLSLIIYHMVASSLNKSH